MTSQSQYSPDNQLQVDSERSQRHLKMVATDTSENITEVEAALCQFHLSKVLQSLILARVGRRG